MTPWTGDQPVARPLPEHRTAQTQNEHRRTYILRVGFEHTIPAFERAKTVHALDRGATVIGQWLHYLLNIIKTSLRFGVNKMRIAFSHLT
jgi:hypothetical protein